MAIGFSCPFTLRVAERLLCICTCAVLPEFLRWLEASKSICSKDYYVLRKCPSVIMLLVTFFVLKPLVIFVVSKMCGSSILLTSHHSKMQSWGPGTILPHSTILCKTYNSSRGWLTCGFTVGAIACTRLLQAHARPNSSMKMGVGPQIHP